MSNIIFETEYGSYKVDAIQVNRYAYGKGKTPAISLWSNEEGPIATITVNLDDPLLTENQAYVDTNNCPEAPMFIEKYGLGKPLGRTRRSGYCIYPLYEFDLEKVRALCNG